MSLNAGMPVILKSQPPMAVVITQNIKVVNDGTRSNQRLWRVELASYTYSLLDRDLLEICTYQWHPEGRSHIKTPHLHIGRGATGNVATFGPRGLHRVHFPTGKIDLADVLRLAIAEFGVEPRREDWEQVLNRE